MLLYSAFLFFLPQAEPPVLPTFYPAVVVGEKAVNIRSFYDKSSPVVASLSPAVPVRIVAERPPWARVQIPGGLVVWVYGDFVDVEDGKGVLNATHVRARPLPSTGPDSYPVGQFNKGDRVWVVVEKDAWLQVLAPESLAAWVPLEHLKKTPSLDSDLDKKSWQTAWNKYAVKRTAKWKNLQTLPTPEEAAQVTLDESRDVPLAGLLSLEPLPVVLPPTFPKEEEILVNLESALLQAEKRMKNHSDAVIKNIDAYNPTLAKGLERVYSTLLFHGTRQKQIERARQGLDKLDALARFWEAAMETRSRRAAVGGDTQTVEKVAFALKPVQPKKYSLEKTLVVGWMEYRPHLYSRAPFALTRGDKTTLLRSYDGRFFLKDFVGKELAVQGILRKDPDTPGVAILAVTQLRVLPRRFSD